MIRRNEWGQRTRHCGGVAALAATGALIGGCTFHHSVAVRYTPLLQAKQLASSRQPETIAVGSFSDGRKSSAIAKERLNPISVHKLQYETVGNVPEVIRSAFVDGFQKSGFSVPIEPTAPPLVSVTGKITAYWVDMKSHWKTIDVDSEVVVEVTLAHRNGRQETVSAQGKYHASAQGSAGTDTMAAALDSALQECVRSLLADHKLAELIKADAEPATLRLD